jgi:hypothetical protein
MLVSQKQAARGPKQLLCDLNVNLRLNNALKHILSGWDNSLDAQWRWPELRGFDHGRCMLTGPSGEKDEGWSCLLSFL